MVSVSGRRAAGGVSRGSERQGQASRPVKASVGPVKGVSASGLEWLVG